MAYGSQGSYGNWLHQNYGSQPSASVPDDGTPWQTDDGSFFTNAWHGIQQFFDDLMGIKAPNLGGLAPSGSSTLLYVVGAIVLLILVFMIIKHL
jgi:hypothetical protein